MELIDPYTLIGKQVPAADGGDYGHLIVGFQASSNDFLTVPIRWSTGEPLHPHRGPALVDAFKASYRYQLDKAR
jgi:hypothetical protein